MPAPQPTVLAPYLRTGHQRAPAGSVPAPPFRGCSVLPQQGVLHVATSFVELLKSCDSLASRMHRERPPSPSVSAHASFFHKEAIAPRAQNPKPSQNTLPS